ncbi:nucleolar RNA helicase II, putative [Trypanosoma cruzi]|nr:nucleolar RNA helicase II, putative [Trypanosoma cruzi]
MHIYNGHIIVCASWGEVRARVHARGHTQRERRKSVCAGGARLSLPHSHAAATTTAAAAHATTRRSKRGEVVWETAVMLSVSSVFAVVFVPVQFYCRVVFFIFPR